MISRLLTKYNLSVDIRKIIHNAGWLLFDKFARLAFGLLVGVWVARHLGPKTYGELAYVVTLVSFFQVIALLGMDSILVRDISNNKKEANEVLGSALFLRLLSGVLCLFLVVLFTYFFNGYNTAVLVLLAGGSLLFQCVDTIDIWFQSQSQSKRTVIAKLSSYTITNILRVFCILTNFPLWTFALLLSVDAMLASIALFYAYRTYKTTEKWKPGLKKCKEILSESWPFMISGISIILYMRVDQVMIKNMLGEASLGVYAASLQFSTLWNFVPLTLSISIAPYIARKKKDGVEIYKKALKNTFLLFSVLGWMITLFVAALSPFIINIMLGAKYSSGTPVLAVHVITNLFICLGVAQSLWIVNERKGSLVLYKSLTGLIVCFISNFILIPIYGIEGAAISAVISQLSACILFNAIFCREIFFMQLRSLIFIR
ncbi:flippase [Salmonella enterica]|uniref:Flippase n=1 Tax=Salmonella enterica subsp. enterica serovar Lattenkamp TaxID=2564671 RepID=A0A5W2LW47_SALET|nr:flippase [Salmonella enterica subsp. enterica serovar Lattenkamp]EAR5595301.1 flippase [Salmonella enterica]EBR0153943.1 flippase [Salmonella enterica subsp. enterica serovar Jodhpur]ECJ3923244.1 flippase [Salmonella enterica subsp. enterica]HBL9981240.1 flippase [Salmonella enterica subsp. enterica serovar Fomeco]